MLKTRIIPCLDVKDGRVVKGVNFVGLRDAGDPVEQAKLYDAAGADELCFLDITATSDNRGLIYEVIAKVAEAISVAPMARPSSPSVRLTALDEPTTTTAAKRM